MDLGHPCDDLTFLSPLSPTRADRLAAYVAGGGPATILDVGCGWAELLVRCLEQAPQARGTGVDLDEASVVAGRRTAEERGVADRVELIVGSAPDALPDRADAVLCLGASQVWGPPVSAQQPLAYAAALAALRALVPRGGRVVYGDAIWSAPPTEAAIAPLGGRVDEFVALGALVDLAVAAGFAPVHVGEASQTEWDDFESGFAARYAHWLAAHPADHPDAAAVRERAAGQRSAYLDGYRGVLGMAYLCLVAV